MTRGDKYNSMTLTDWTENVYLGMTKESNVKLYCLRGDRRNTMEITYFYFQRLYKRAKQ